MAQIYEVTIDITANRAAEFETYMAATHIPEVLATGCFAAAFFAKEGDRFVAAYHVNTPDDMERYLTLHASVLRDDVLHRFGDGVQISRRTLDVIKLFPGD